jgi:hypothetical protein
MRHADGGTPVGDVCRQLGVSDARRSMSGRRSTTSWAWGAARSLCCSSKRANQIRTRPSDASTQPSETKCRTLFGRFDRVGLESPMIGYAAGKPAASALSRVPARSRKFRGSLRSYADLFGPRTCLWLCCPAEQASRQKLPHTFMPLHSPDRA